MSGALSWIAALSAIGGTFIAAVAVWVAYDQLKASREQDLRGRKLQLSGMYLQRYWEINDGLLTHPKGEMAHKQQVHRLLTLTEDEFDAARSGLLDPAYWEKWHGWIAHPSQRETRFKDLRLVDPEPPNFEYLQKCLGDRELTEAPAHTWTHCPARTAG